MSEENPNPAEGLEVRTYFVRGRNAMVARADFGELYVDYYLHQGQHGYQHKPSHDGMLKEALAALTLHCASRPWNETCAWTIHFENPLLNLFVTGDNRTSSVAGQLFTENVKQKDQNLFLADIVRAGEPARRSAVEFEGADSLLAVERYYAQSEQRPARYFRLGPEEFVMVSAQPGCDLPWLEALDLDTMQVLDERETLSLLETRYYHWNCGCSQGRMFEVLAPIMVSDPEGLFGEGDTVRMSCPRCGARYVITREGLEAYLQTLATKE
ncbi:MAG: Hsp33 family molecular chaperone HslO [Chthoniobacteraceae bacterium]